MVDGLRGDGGGSVAGEPPSDDGDQPSGLDRRALGTAADVETLRAGGAVGELLYTDRDCRPGRLFLPDLTQLEAGGAPACSQKTRSGWTAVGTSRDIVPPSCTLRDVPAPQGCGLAVVPGRRLREALQPGGRILVEEVAWLNGWRMAVIVRDEERGLDVLAIFERGRLVSRPALASPDLSGLSISPRRQLIAVRPSSGGVFVLDRKGNFTLPGRFRFPLLDVRDVAWSPDETWTAIATRERIYLVATDPSTSKVIDLPLAATDLEWQREAARSS